MSGQGDNVVRLGCAEQAAIAEELREYWQHVVDEGVPEHLRGLIARFPCEVDREDQKARGVATVLVGNFRPGEGSRIESAEHQHRVEPAEGE